MPVTELLVRNAREHGNEVALVELNPRMEDPRKLSFKEFDLVQQTVAHPFRRQITWQVFDEKANRVANMLIDRGVKKGDKVAILMFNCLEWLPIYFGILKSGAIAVPFNFRYTANEISYCLSLAEVEVLFFGPEFINRIQTNSDAIGQGRLLFYVGDGCPEFAESYRELVADYASTDPQIPLTNDDFGAIYFSSGTTGFPKAILHKHLSLYQAAEMEAVHHQTTKDDCFLCIPPLYHTGAKFHWMGSLWTCSKAVLLKGTKPDVILKAVSDNYVQDKNFPNAIRYYRDFLAAKRNATMNDWAGLGSLYSKQSDEAEDAAGKEAALMQADGVYKDMYEKFADAAEYATYMRANINSKLDPDSKKGLAKPYYEKLAEMLSSKAEKSKSDISMRTTAWHYLMAYNFLQKNDKATAKEFAAKILEINPDYAPAQQIRDIK